MDDNDDATVVRGFFEQIEISAPDYVPGMIEAQAAFERMVGRLEQANWMLEVLASYGVQTKQEAYALGRGPLVKDQGEG